MQDLNLYRVVSERRIDLILPFLRFAGHHLFLRCCLKINLCCEYFNYILWLIKRSSEYTVIWWGDGSWIWNFSRIPLRYLYHYENLWSGAKRLKLLLYWDWRNVSDISSFNLVLDSKSITLFSFSFSLSHFLSFLNTFSECFWEFY